MPNGITFFYLRFFLFNIKSLSILNEVCSSFPLILSKEKTTRKWIKMKEKNQFYEIKSYTSQEKIKKKSLFVTLGSYSWHNTKIKNLSLNLSKFLHLNFRLPVLLFAINAKLIISSHPQMLVCVFSLFCLFFLFWCSCQPSYPSKNIHTPDNGLRLFIKYTFRNLHCMYLILYLRLYISISSTHCCNT